MFSLEEWKKKGPTTIQSLSIKQRSSKTQEFEKGGYVEGNT